MRKSIFLILGICISGNALLAQEFQPGAAAIGVGGCFTTSDDFWSAVNNQASLADFEHPVAGIGYDNEFLLKELSTKHVAAIVPFKPGGVFSLNIAQFGYSAFNLNRIGLAYGMKFSSSFSGGIQLDYIHLHLDDVYGNSGAFTFELGLMYKLNDKWIFGTHVFNPVSVSLSGYNDERMNASVSAGASFIASEQVTLFGEVEKQMAYKPSIKGGIDYTIMKFLSIRAGATSNPTRLSFGFGLGFGNFKIDVAGKYHQILGFSPSTGIVYTFNQTAK